MAANALYAGKTDAILLQGFHWTSNEHSWYRILAEMSGDIQAAGFDYVWFPPPSASADPHGYLPTEWYNLNSKYGTQDELKAAIAALRKGKRSVEAIADVVVNHRCGVKDWADFQNPHFAPDGTTDPKAIEEANRKAVVQEDEWKEAGGKPAGSSDTGEQFNGGRDLDHTNPLVQQAIIKWLQWLKKEIGFVGWRWDLVKGYHPRFVGLYNDATQPAISVAEFADSEPLPLVDWINRTYGKPDVDGGPDRTGGKSCAFDFPTRGFLKRAFEQNNYELLKSVEGRCPGLIGHWPAMAVTFLDNHDTEPANHNDPYPTERVAAGYAYLLTHPGKPCVFWPHLFDWGQALRKTILSLIQLRRRARLYAESGVNIRLAQTDLYAAVIDDKIALKLGPAPWQPDGDDWQSALDGDDFAVWSR
jgi:alpha-amylase